MKRHNNFKSYKNRNIAVQKRMYSYFGLCTVLIVSRIELTLNHQHSQTSRSYIKLFD